MMKGVIFDLDGVIVSTDDYHYHAWKRMADDEGISFGRESNKYLRGVSRMESLEVVLRHGDKSYTPEEKRELAERKNRYYRESLNDLTPDEILPGVYPLLDSLRERNIKIAIGSSSKNTPVILEKIGLDKSFDAVADGNDISRSKPDPEVFLIAARKLGIKPAECVVVEDAEAGIDAALAAGMVAVGVGDASNYRKADYRISGLDHFPLDELTK